MSLLVRRERSAMSPPGESRTLLVRGVRGYLAGQTFRVRHGESITVGRSRSCHVSLQRSDAFNGSSEAGLSFKKTSRKHVRIAFPHPDLVEIENLSKNGTLVDGARIDKIILSDLAGRTVELEFGEAEKLVLSVDENGRDAG